MLTKNRQSGATLITALIMLVVLTLLVVSSIRSSNTNLRIAGNMQMQEEAVNVAQQAVEQILSTDFTKAPAAVTISVDIDNNGTNDYTSQVEKPTCSSSISITNGDLISSNSADTDCISRGVMTAGGYVGASGVVSTAQSNCYKQSWTIKSAVTDSSTGANTVLHQGVYIRVPSETECPL